MTSSATKPKKIEIKVHLCDALEIFACVMTTVVAIYLMVLSRTTEVHYTSSGQPYISYNYNPILLASGAIFTSLGLTMLARVSIEIAVRLACKDDV